MRFSYQLWVARHCDPFFFLHSMKSPVILVAIACLALSACKSKPQTVDALPPSTMVEFLEGAYRIEGRFAVETQFRFDVLSEQTAHAYDSLLAANHVTKEEVERSLQYYALHLDEYKPIMDSVAARFESGRTEDNVAARSPILQ